MAEIVISVKLKAGEPIHKHINDDATVSPVMTNFENSSSLRVFFVFFAGTKNINSDNEAQIRNFFSYFVN